MQLEQSHDNKAKTLMETLTNESSRLIGCIKLLNHDVHKAMLMGQMDESLSNSHKLGAAFYTNLSVSSACLCDFMGWLIDYTNLSVSSVSSYDGVGWQIQGVCVFVISYNSASSTRVRAAKECEQQKSASSTRVRAAVVSVEWLRLQWMCCTGCACFDTCIG